MEIINTLSAILTALGTLALACTARHALGTWKDELKASRQFELARRIAIQLGYVKTGLGQYDLRLDMLRNATEPPSDAFFGFAGTMFQNQLDSHMLWASSFNMERKEVEVQLTALSYEADAIMGQDIKKGITDLCLDYSRIHCTDKDIRKTLSPKIAVIFPTTLEALLSNMKINEETVSSAYRKVLQLEKELKPFFALN